MMRAVSFGPRWIYRDVLPIGLVMLFLVVIAPIVMSEFRQDLLARYMTFAIIAIGIDLIWGYTGMLSLGQAVWFGLGGYAVAAHLKLVASGDSLPDFMGWSGVDALPWFWEPFHYAWFAIPMALIGPAVIAFLLGFLIFRSRVKGAYFAIVTQAFALMMSIFFVGQQGFTGGTSGVTNFTTMFGFTLADDGTRQMLYYATCGFLLLTYLSAMFMTRSRFGRIMVAIRDDEDRVRFAGYNVALIKAIVYAVSAAMAGLAGALFVPQVGAITPSSMGIVPSIEYVLLVAVGGRGTLLGAVIGALLVSWLRTNFSEAFPHTWQYLYGGLFIGAVVLFPTGLVGAARSLGESPRAWYDDVRARVRSILRFDDAGPPADVDAREVSRSAD